MAQIPIELFEPSMPVVMRPLIDAARSGQGELAWLLTEEGRQRGSPVQALLRGHPPLPVEVAGWAAGITMFEQRSASDIVDIMAMHGVTAPMPFLLEAVGIGLGAGVECPIETWKVLERLATRHELPDSLIRAAPVGLISSSSTVRKAALAVALRRPQLAQLGVEKARTKKLTPTQVKRLEEAAAALGLTSPPAMPERNAVLQRLVEEWGRTWDERLMAPIRAAGAAESAKRGPLEAASKSELERAWLALAKNQDPGDVARLLETPWPGAWKLALERVRALDRFPADPRIAAAMKENTTRYTSWAAREVREAAERVASRMHAAKRRDAAAELLRESASLTPHQGSLEALWKAFWDDPSDEGQRAVLADALQSAGDARGEFISLQLAIENGTADAKAQRRADDLLEQHIDSWAGGLPGVARASREFRRGFLSAVKLTAEPEHLLKSLDRQEWRTIERLRTDFGRAGQDEVSALLRRMPSLRVLLFEHFNDFFVNRWKEAFPGVKLLGTDQWLPDQRLAPFPALEMICVGADPRAALEAARRAGLKGLMLTWSALDTALEAFESVTVREVVELRHAPGMSRDHEPRGWTVRVTRAEPEHAQLFHSGAYKKGSFEELASILLAHGRTKLQIHAPAGLEKKLEAAPHGKAELTFIHLPFDVFLPPPIT